VIRQSNDMPTAAAASQLASLLGGWPESAHGTLAQRLAHAIRGAVAAGLIGDGAYLPAERALADALAVSRSTVTAALDELRADGVVESRRGSGSVVRGGHRAVPSTRIDEHCAEWPGIDLASGNPPDPSHWPPLSVDVADLIADGGGPGVQPLGLVALRAVLAARHTEDGRLTDVAQVHVTAGAHQAVALVVGTCTAPGEAVAIEDTTYPGIFDIIDRLGARALPVATDGAGLVPDALERVLREHQPKALYIQSGPHNPTGRVPSPGRLRALALIVDRYDTVVVEDCALADLAFGGRVRPELADLCRRAVVTSVGSFSKVGWGGLRVGWLRAPAPLIERTMHLRLANDLGASAVSQLFALRLLPHMAELARSRRQTLTEAVAHAGGRLRSDFPTWRFRDPEGGSVLWVELPVADSGPFVRLAGRHGVHVAPGSVARAGRAADPHIRICVDRSPDLVEIGLQRLGLAWRETERAPEPVLG
jgi:DNA-binding transcriptional MocR family regulator